MHSSYSKVSSLLCDLIFDLHLSPAVDSSTQITGSILNLVISNSADTMSNIRIHHNHLISSDDFIVAFSIKVVLPWVTWFHQSPFLNYSRADFNGMCYFLPDWDICACYHSSDIDVIWSLLESAISNAIDKFVPLVTRSHRHSSLPKWFNQDLRHEIKCLQTLHTKWNLSSIPYLLRKLWHSESQRQANISHAKTCYEHKLLNHFALGINSRIYSHIQFVLQQDQLHVPLRMFLKICIRCRWYRQAFIITYTSSQSTPLIPQAYLLLPWSY